LKSAFFIFYRSISVSPWFRVNFYINRTSRNLPAAQRKLLERAKMELRNLYGHA